MLFKNQILPIMIMVIKPNKWLPLKPIGFLSQMDTVLMSNSVILKIINFQLSLSDLFPAILN
jgi:hypothetical protein